MSSTGRKSVAARAPLATQETETLIWLGIQGHSPWWHTKVSVPESVHASASDGLTPPRVGSGRRNP
jgi:hypothetical protein